MTRSRAHPTTLLTISDMGQRTPWTEADAIDGANELFILSYPLVTAFDQVNPSQDTLARNVLGNSVAELVALHDDYHENVYTHPQAPRRDDRAGAALSSYLRSFYADLRLRVRDGEPFNMLSRRISYHPASYQALRDGGGPAVASVLVTLRDIEQIELVLDQLVETGVDPVDLAFNHSLHATLVAVTRAPSPRHQQDIVRTTDQQTFASVRAMFPDDMLLGHGLTWYGPNHEDRSAALEQLGLLDDLQVDERETFTVLARDWTATVGELKRASITITRA